LEVLVTGLVCDTNNYQREVQELYTALSLNEYGIFEQTEFARHRVGFTHNPRTQSHLERKKQEGYGLVCKTNREKVCVVCETN